MKLEVIIQQKTKRKKMKRVGFIFIGILFFLGVLVSASSTSANTFETENNDPLPTGGAECTYDLECNYPDGGECLIETTTSNNVSYQIGYCVCDDAYGDPDCTYHRKSKELAAGLEWLCLCSAGGAGNFYLERNGEGSGQFVLCLPMFLMICIGCCFCCAACGCGDFNCDCEGCGAAAGAILGILMALTGCFWSLASFIMILQGDVVDGNGYALRA